MRSEYTNKETEVMSPGETTRQEQIKEETSEEELNKKHGWKQTIKRKHRKNQNWNIEESRYFFILVATFLKTNIMLNSNNNKNSEFTTEKPPKNSSMTLCAINCLYPLKPVVAEGKSKSLLVIALVTCNLQQLHLSCIDHVCRHA